MSVEARQTKTRNYFKNYFCSWTKSSVDVGTDVQVAQSAVGIEAKLLDEVIFPGRQKSTTIFSFPKKEPRLFLCSSVDVDVGVDTHDRRSTPDERRKQGVLEKSESNQSDYLG